MERGFLVVRKQLGSGSSSSSSKLQSYVPLKALEPWLCCIQNESRNE